MAILKTSLVCCVLFTLITRPSLAAGFGHGIAFGAHYFHVLGEIDDSREFEEDGVGYNFSYRLCLSKIFSLDGVLQSYPSGYYQAEKVWSPEVYAVLGRTLYVGIGALAYRVTWSEPFRDEPGDERDWSDVTYALIGGVELPLILDVVTLDINARYVFSDWQEVEEFQEDTLTFGGRVRIYLTRR